MSFLDSSLPRSRLTWAEIDLDAVVHNTRELGNLLGKNVEMMAVVKSGAYGHGAPEVSQAALEGGAACLGVAFPEEGIELRKEGIHAPVLLLGYTPPSQMEWLLEYELTPTIISQEEAYHLSEYVSASRSIFPVHVKVDTGMGRLGFLPSRAAEEVEKISRLPGLEVQGLMTHLASADEEDPGYTYQQLDCFNAILEECRKRGVHPRIIHAANSAGMIRFPEAHFNLVRPGLSLYGYYPSPAVKAFTEVDLKPVLTFKSRVVMLKRVPSGTYLSYGGTYCTDREAEIATIPVGYADGFNRLLSNRGQVLIKGQRAPVVGRVCMDYIMADVTGLEGVETGAEVVLYGKQGAEAVTAWEVAELQGTIPYEVLCAVSKRVPRWYYRNGEVVAYADLLVKKGVNEILWQY